MHSLGGLGRSEKAFVYQPDPAAFIIIKPAVVPGHTEWMCDDHLTFRRVADHVAGWLSAQFGQA